jgi:hypothetical protein
MRQKCPSVTGLEADADNSEYILSSRHWNAWQDYNFMIDNKTLENVAKFKYLGKTITIQNSFREEIKST